jgi:RecB family endonuclease NucS
MPIYDRPTKVLMQEFAREHLKRNQTFEKKDVIAWFQDKYPKIKPSTVSMHVESMSVNSTFRKHHPNVRPGAGYDVFFKIEPGRFRLWDMERDPKPLYRADFLRADVESDERVAETEEAEDESSIQGEREFAFERDLRNYLSRNLHVLEEGLHLYVDEDREFTGIEFQVGGRFIDILAVDKNGGFLIVELKVSRGYDRALGQLLRYMAWVSKNLANGKRVRGVIVASEITEDLKLAASLVEGVKLWQYQLSFHLSPVVP